MPITYIYGKQSTSFIWDWVNANDKEVSIKQLQSLFTIRSKWHGMATPYIDNLNDCIMVNVIGKTGHAMVLGVEKDGYTHS